eukprot:jgi/Mesvir1/20398/Mv12302-RA.1
MTVDSNERAQALAHKDIGNEFFQSGQFEKAVSAFTRAIALDPTDKVFYSNRSAALASLLRFEEAQKDAEKCVSLDTTWAKGYSRLGFAEYKLKRYDAALAAYKAGLAIDPKNAALIDGMAMLKSAAEEAVDPVIGIDLGTTFSCVAVWRNGKAEVLPNLEGNSTTPSWVAFTKNGKRLVGDAAKRQAANNPSRTMFNIKRIIGRQFDECREDIKLMPFPVVADGNGKPEIHLEDVAQREKVFTPEQVSAMVLTYMKESAEAALGRPVAKAVITVPAYFTDAQRRLTKDAGAIAGLEVLRIINEPTAAALAYGLDKKAENAAASKAKGKGAEGGEDTSAKNVLVFDLGGGTFDVSLLRIQGGMFEVKATAGDTHLGGEDLDSAFADWVRAQVRQKRKGKDIFAGNDFAIRKLRNACEVAKRELSMGTKTHIEMSVQNHGTINLDVTREQFESIVAPILSRCMDAVKRVLSDSKVVKSDVDDVVLVGGSTRVPQVQAQLQEFFDGKPLCKSVHPDEAVAVGAAVQGAILSGVRDASTDSLLLVDVIPMSLGIECERKQFAVVVPRNSTIPCVKSHEFTTVEDYQTTVDVRVFEGERAVTTGNHLLGEFQINGIERAKKGEAKVLVTFDINSNGLLTVTARDKVTGATANVEIEHKAGRLSPEEIKRMQEDAARFREEDERLAQQLDDAEEEEEALAAELEALRAQTKH